MDTTGTLFMPPGGSILAPQVDALFDFILYTSIVFFIIVVLLMAYFIIRYRRKPGERGVTPGITKNIPLEILWSVIPTILVIIVFFWGFHIYLEMAVVPKGAYEVKVTGQQWFWSFSYPNGTTTVNKLYVPVGRPIKLLMSSKDVIHSFYVPDFRMKMDVLPNRYTVTWFEAPKVGDHNLMCAEYCGKSHSDMIGEVYVLGEREFADWLESSQGEGEGIDPAKFGESLFKSRACHTCHNVDGTAKTGPALNGIFGEQQALSNGQTITIDENYLRESILNPRAKIVAGFQPVMPTFQGILSQKQVDALIAYIKSMKK